MVRERKEFDTLAEAEEAKAHFLNSWTYVYSPKADVLEEENKFVLYTARYSSAD